MMTKITKEDIYNAQKEWGEGIVTIGQVFLDNGDFNEAATSLVNRLYNYGVGEVLFCPTKAAVKQFRLTKSEAVSYFVGGEVEEDKGFALQPWSKVRFENAGIMIKEDFAIAMGNYFFTDSKSGDEVKVEYTFGYSKDKSGKLSINLHHSALPYSG